jgi:methanogenic corrinoid protein MtbC1
MARERGEQHDLGLIALGLALRARGWRIVYLGTDTPIDTIEHTSRQLHPTLIVLSAVSSQRVQPVADQLHRLARRHPLALGGPAASNGALQSADVHLLAGDPTTAASNLTTRAQQHPT